MAVEKTYQDQVNERLEALTGQAGELAQIYLSYQREGYYKRSSWQNKFITKIFSDNPKTAGEAFANGPYQIIEAVAGKRNADIAQALADRLHLYIYSRSLYRRSFRTKDIYAYAERIISLMSFVYMQDEPFDLAHCMCNRSGENAVKTPLDYYTLADWISLAIDNDDQAVIGKIKDACLSDNNTTLLDRIMIIGALRSGNMQMHKLICDLLLAAKLQEGLRQSILESADSGRLEAFILLIKTVLDNDLIRFSSVVRAVDVWMGIGEESTDNRQRIVDKLLHLAYTYLTDELAREAAEDSSDVLEVYVALWAAGVLEISEITGFLDKLMQGEKYRRLVAMYFVSNADYDKYKIEMSQRYLDEPDIDVLCYILGNINYYVSAYGDKEKFLTNSKAHRTLESVEYRNHLFTRLLEILPGIPQEGHVVQGKPFDWCSKVLTKASIFAKLFTIAGNENDGKRNVQLLANMDYADSDSRQIFLKYIIDNPQTEDERQYNFNALSDKSINVRTQALNNIKKFNLYENEDEFIIKLLSLKTADLRQGAVSILLNLPDTRINSAINELLSDKNENKRLAGLDMLLRLVKENRWMREDAVERTVVMPKTTDREKILLDELITPQSEYNSENGFGMYDPDYASKLSLPVSVPVSKTIETDGIQPKAFDLSIERMTGLFDSFIILLKENKDYTFTAETYSGQKEDCVLGSLKHMRYPKYLKGTDGQERTIDDFVLPEVWKGWLIDNQVTSEELLMFRFINYVKMSTGYTLSYTPWVNHIINRYFAVYKIQTIAEHCKCDNENIFFNIITLLQKELPILPQFTICVDLVATLVEEVPKNAWMLPVMQKRNNTPTYEEFDFEDLHNIFENEEFLSIARESDSQNPVYFFGIKEIGFLLSNMKSYSKDDTQFAQYVACCYKIGSLADLTYVHLSPVELTRAYKIGIVPKDALYKRFFKPEYRDRSIIRNYAGKPINKIAREETKQYPELLEAGTEAAARMIEIEIKRGDSPTEVSKLAQEIRYHEGAENFANILVALGDETFIRGYSWGINATKKGVLSNLLKASHPKEEDNVKSLAKALDGRVCEKRLLEAAMYSPSWLPIVADLLKWKGLESTAWYFHAHINENFSAEKETEIARYSSITPQEFADGAFDTEWFKGAYKSLGKERFEVLYDCAKYLTEGSNHRRAQLFADASLGKLKIKELESEIKDKRNKDKLLAYSLIALKKDKEKDLLKRYEFIQAFLKESKQFGAQRRESEGKCCRIALDNLARTAGFEDSLRFSWRMETLKIEQISNFFTPKDCDGVMIYVEVDEQGVASLVCEKTGKKMSSVPAKLKNNKYVIECKDVVVSLKAQQKRAKISLENAMIRRDVFTYGELADLMKHPVISPLLDMLLFASEDHSDMFKGFTNLDADAELRIAHPYDLYMTKIWMHWQRHAFENKLVQPFKQIFRELYLPNADELHENTVSRRYAGHQVQAQKTVALLKSRGWTVDYEDGLQKVYYKENIITTMYAAADWFSPADVEAPTLETVCFFDRNTRKALPLSDIAPMIFSEVMRDIDLVVSIAHVGGVDPEASHSTIEMRGAIVRELLALLRVENAQVRDRHVFVQGSLGEYTVHLGSGGVQMMGKGAINILAIPSQHRGRVFLPFADEDPKTAEIMSKILLLADDKAIKDPGILEQIRV